MLNIGYSCTPDYTGLYPPKFIKVVKSYNTVLIPIKDITNRPEPSDTVSFLYNNKVIKQKVGLDCGIVTFYNKEYYYFYIIPGFSQYCPDTIFIDNKEIKLNKYFDPQYVSKIINGLLILPNNFNYAFGHINYGLILANNKNIFTTIIGQNNKYNYYMANTNNTLLYILDSINTQSLYELNNTVGDIYIRSLFNKNYPLGSCYIESKGVSNIRLRFGNNILKFNDKININYLPSGKYKILFLDDNDNLITINTVNNKNWNKDFFDIEIIKKIDAQKTESSILVSDKFDLPNKDHSNLLINIYPFNTVFELYGPNNFYKKFITGYQRLYNILPGKYNIKYQNYHTEILVIKNDNNYFSNINYGKI